VRTRFLFATNHNLKEKVTQGAFRKDLYYRLCAHLIDIPPLRERKEDLPLLTNSLLAEAAKSFGCDKPLVPPELIDLLSSYNFPGNIRELRAMIYDAISLHKGPFLSLTQFRKNLAGALNEHAREDAYNAYEQTPENMTIAFGSQLPTIKQVNQALIDEAMRRADGNQSSAARMLGISPQALSKRLKLRVIS
jgi:DNA-binding NtrC family response regulator